MIVLVIGSNGNTATRVVRFLKEKSTLKPGRDDRRYRAACEVRQHRIN